MPLTGIEIFKLLPKTNCGDCGVPTCLAFAMNLASGKAELSLCPHVSEEAKSKLDEASAPPILPVTIGDGGKALKIGGETVMFRHEKRFENPPGLAILISDTMVEAEVNARVVNFIPQGVSPVYSRFTVITPLLKGRTAAMHSQQPQVVIGSLTRL